MAITTATTINFRFVSAADFEAKVLAGTLAAGSWYVTESVLYVATGPSDYIPYGGCITEAAPADPDAAEEGLFYYDPATGTLRIAIKIKSGTNAGTIQYVNLTESFSSITYGSGADTGKIYLTQLDGTNVELVIPKATAIRASGATDALFATEKAVADFVSAQIGGIVGPMRPKGSLSSAGDIVTAFATAPKSGDVWRIGATIASAAAFGGATLQAGDWIIFTDSLTSTSPPFATSEYIHAAGVENAAVNSLNSTDTVLPLSAAQGKALKDMFDSLDSGKMDVIDSATGGELVISNADGSVSESGKTFSAGVLPSAAAASTAKITNEKQIADALAAKADGMGSGSANVLVTATSGGGVQRTAATISSGGSIPDSATASPNVVPNEAQVRASLDAVAASATLNWLLD